VTRSEEMKGIREKMQDDIDEVNKIAHQVKNRLERLDKMNEQALGRNVSLFLSLFYTPPTLPDKRRQKKAKIPRGVLSLPAFNLEYHWAEGEDQAVR